MKNLSEKKICLIAFEQHVDLVDGLVVLLHQSHIKIILFTSDALFDILRSSDTDKLKVFRSSNIKKHKRQLKTNLTLLRSCHQIILVTFSEAITFYSKLAKTVKLSIIVHNTHFTFSDNRHYLSPRSPLSIVNQLIRTFRGRKTNAKRNLISSAKQLLFLSQHMLNYAISNYPEISSRSFQLLYHYYEGKTMKNEEDFTIIIPGGVNSLYRDYTILKEWLKKNQGLRNIRLVFLGNSSARHCRNFLDNLRKEITEKTEIISFDRYITSREYMQWLEKATILLAPLKREIDFCGYRERYGYSKVTGSIFDAVRSGKWLMLPSFYPTENHYKEQILIYDHLNLSKLLDEHYKRESPMIFEEFLSLKIENASQILTALLDL